MIFNPYTGHGHTVGCSNMGLGATMISIIQAAINKVPKVRQVFQLPESHEAVMSVIVGYPKYKYKRTIRRNKHKVHWVK